MPCADLALAWLQEIKGKAEDVKDEAKSKV